jgi:hypothetical protein
VPAADVVGICRMKIRWERGGRTSVRRGVRVDGLEGIGLFMSVRVPLSTSGDCRVPSATSPSPSSRAAPCSGGRRHAAPRPPPLPCQRGWRRHPGRRPGRAGGGGDSAVAGG